MNLCCTVNPIKCQWSTGDGHCDAPLHFCEDHIPWRARDAEWSARETYLDFLCHFHRSEYALLEKQYGIAK